MLIDLPVDTYISWSLCMWLQLGLRLRSSVLEYEPPPVWLRDRNLYMRQESWWSTCLLRWQRKEKLLWASLFRILPHLLGWVRQVYVAVSMCSRLARIPIQWPNWHLVLGGESDNLGFSLGSAIAKPCDFGCPLDSACLLVCKPGRMNCNLLRFSPPWAELTAFNVSSVWPISKWPAWSSVNLMPSR